jgi:hypothetical protein
MFLRKEASFLPECTGFYLRKLFMYNDNSSNNDNNQNHLRRIKCNSGIEENIVTCKMEVTIDFIWNGNGIYWIY